MHFASKLFTDNKINSLICLLYVILAITLFSYNTPFYYPDSTLYLEYNSARSFSYISFVKLIGADLIPKVQVIIFGLSLFFLGILISKFNRTISIAVTLLIAVNFHLLDFHVYTMTESIHASLNILFITLFAAYILYHRLYWLIAMSICAGIAISVKISAVSLLPAVFIAPLLIKSDGRKKHIVVSLMPAFLIFIAERNFSYQNKGIEGLVYGSLISAVLYPKAALTGYHQPDVNIESMNQIDKALFRFIEKDMKKIRETIDSLDYFSGRTLETSFEATINLKSKIDRIMTDVRKAHPETQNESINERKIKVALIYIMNNFGSYMKLAFNNYVGLLFYVFPSDSFIKQANKQLSTIWPVPFIGFDSDKQGLSVRNVEFNWRRASHVNSHIIGNIWKPIPYNGFASSVIWVTMTLIAIITAAFAFLGLALAIIKRNTAEPILWLAIIPGFVAHTHIFIVGAIALAESRYLIPQWPMLATSLVASLFVMSRWIRQRSYIRKLSSQI